MNEDTGCGACMVSATGICDYCEERLADLRPPRRSSEALTAAVLTLAALPRPRPAYQPKDRAALIPKRKRDKRQRTPEEKAERRERKKKNKRRRARRRS